MLVVSCWLLNISNEVKKDVSHGTWDVGREDLHPSTGSGYD